LANPGKFIPAKCRITANTFDRIWKDKYLDEDEIRARDLKKSGGKAPELVAADSKSEKTKEKGGLFNRKKG
jgi:hypothetical protein